MSDLDPVETPEEPPADTDADEDAVLDDAPVEES